MKLSKNFNVQVLISPIYTLAFYKENKYTDLPVMHIKIISTVRSLAFLSVL